MDLDARAVRTGFLLRMIEPRFASGFVAPAPAPLDGFRPARLLVLAPHPDDEVIGCAGLMRQCLDAGGTVAALFMTVEGGRSIVKPSLRDGADRRLAECADAQRLLGYQVREHLDFPERSLAARGPAFEALVQRLETRLEAHDPEALLVPNPDDVHPDHAAAARAAGEAVLRRRRAGRLRRLRDVLLYEVWGPARADAYCCLAAPTVALKQRALDCYESQLQSVDYHAVMAAITRARLTALCATPDARPPGPGETLEGYECLRGDAAVAARLCRARAEEAAHAP